MLRMTITFSVCVILVACGGGGNEGTSDGDPGGLTDIQEYGSSDNPIDAGNDVTVDIPDKVADAVETGTDQWESADTPQPECSSDGECNDYDPCTSDSCDGGTCQNEDIPGCVPEVCDNGVDDNDDQWIDCDDPHCAEAEHCTTLPQGDTCGNPLTVNDGLSVGADMIGKNLEYKGDTTDMSDQYTSCGAEPKVRDAVYRLQLSEPLFVTATHDFDGDEPDDSPWSVLSVYLETCYPSSLLECEWGSELGAVLERTFAAGTYYFVVDGDSYWYEDWGSYTLTFAFEAPPDTETVCWDAIDDDGDGKTDCLDEDCEQEAVCNACPVEADLGCGDAVTGKFESDATDHYYTFVLDKDEDIAVTVTVPEGNDDHIDINFKEGPPQLGCDNLYMVSEQVWHSPATNSAGFSAKAGEDYVIKLILGVYDQGDYSIELQCGDGPESECNDGKDNDTDSLTDCEDPNCFKDDACSGGKGGDDCGDAYEVNGGNPIGLDDVGEDGMTFEHWNTTKDRTNALSAACAPASIQGPDVVYGFEVTDKVYFDVFVEFMDFMLEPAIYLFAGTCTDAALVECGQTIFGLAMMGAELEPGEYFLVVDSNAIGFDGKPHADDYWIEFTFNNTSPPEDCGNGFDDDEDGDTDCQDSECFENDSCTGGKTGESCATAYPVNGGQDLQYGETYVSWNTTIGKDNDLAGGCSPYSKEGPDSAHYFVLTMATAVTAAVQFENGFTPALSLYMETCGPDDDLACETADWDTATISMTLNPGKYFLVVDSGDAIFMEPMSQDYVLTVDAALP